MEKKNYLKAEEIIKQQNIIVLKQNIIEKAIKETTDIYFKNRHLEIVFETTFDSEFKILLNKKLTELNREYFELEREFKQL